MIIDSIIISAGDLRPVSLYGRFSQLRFAKFQVEGLESQDHCLFSLQNALWKFKSLRGWAHSFRFSFWKLAVLRAFVFRVQPLARFSSEGEASDHEGAPQKRSPGESLTAKLSVEKLGVERTASTNCMFSNGLRVPTVCFQHGHVLQVHKRKHLRMRNFTNWHRSYHNAILVSEKKHSVKISLCLSNQQQTPVWLNFWSRMRRSGLGV